MKESIGGISLFNIVIVFVLVFTGYVCLSLNYSKAYSIKDELLTIIKNQGGVCYSQTSSKDNNCYNFTYFVSTLLQDTNYHATGNCDKNWEGYEGWVGYSRDGVPAQDNSKAAFCVLGVSASGNSELSDAVYYKVKVFYQIDLPILSFLFNFNVSGETGRIYSPNECSVSKLNYCWCGNNSCDYVGEDD